MNYLSIITQFRQGLMFHNVIFPLGLKGEDKDFYFICQNHRKNKTKTW